MSKILVHRIGAEPIELERSQCHFFDRSRLMTGQACPKKRELQYHWQGTGVESTYQSEDLAVGSSVHEGLEMMLEQTKLGFEDVEVLTNAASAFARDKMLEAGAKGLMIQDDDRFFEQSPEIAQLLIYEQANLAYALVWTFGRRRLASLLERYEVVAVEPEICWLVGTYVPKFEAKEMRVNGKDLVLGFAGETKTHIVMMSRPDAILRSREDGKLWTVSWKTAQKFDLSYVEELEIHSQTITEGLALEAMYGEPSAGTFFGYFLKGSKVFDPEIGMKRYTSGLIRPYHSYGGIGDLGPQHFKFAGEYTNAAGDTKRMTKGWYRTDIWNLMTMPEWLEMLDTGEVQPEAVGRDWLGEQTVEPMLQLFNRAHADRWVKKAIQNETDWMAIVAGDRVAAEHEESCFNKWGKKCMFYDVCWHGDTVERQLASGRKRIRGKANHPAEFGGEDGSA